MSTSQPGKQANSKRSSDGCKWISPCSHEALFSMFALSWICPCSNWLGAPRKREAKPSERLSNTKKRETWFSEPRRNESSVRFHQARMSWPMESMDQRTVILVYLRIDDIMWASGMNKSEPTITKRLYLSASSTSRPWKHIFIESCDEALGARTCRWKCPHTSVIWMTLVVTISAKKIE